MSANWHTGDLIAGLSRYASDLENSAGKARALADLVRSAEAASTDGDLRHSALTQHALSLILGTQRHTAAGSGAEHIVFMAHQAETWVPS